MSITVHTLVKNEARYLWFAVASVAPWVDEIMLWDTGSTDDTPKIIDALSQKFGKKITTKQVGSVDEYGYTKARQEMLEATKSDWFMIVDGDEVWWDGAIQAQIELISKNGKNLNSIGCRYYNIVGDIFHYQSEDKGMYEIDGMKGHLTIRAVSIKIPGLHMDKPHGQHGIFNSDGTPIQNMSKDKRIFLEGYSYIHFTHMQRSSSKENESMVPKRQGKYKYDTGLEFPYDFFYPEVFFRNKPDFVPSPWNTRSASYSTLSMLISPGKAMKQKFLTGKTGY